MAVSPSAPGVGHEAMSEAEPPSYPIGSVDNALQLLRAFGENRSLRVTDAGRLLGVSRSTAYRMLQMLQYHGLIARTDAESKSYSAGPELVRMALSIVRNLDIRSASRSVMETLRDQTQETIHLCELNGRSTIFLDSIESQRFLRVGTRAGVRLPAHATASGKVLLAEMSAEELRALYPERTLPKETSHTITTRRVLEAQLAEIRAAGFATNFGESEDNVTAVAVAIRPAQGQARYSLACAIPTSRINEADVPAMAEVLSSGALKIGAFLP